LAVLDRVQCGRFANVNIKRAPAVIAAAVSAVLAARPASAQQSQLERFDRQLEQLQREVRVEVDKDVPMDQRALIDYGAYTNTLGVSIDDPAQNAAVFLQQELVAYGRVNIDGAHEFFVRGRWTYRHFFEGNNPIGKNDDTDTAIDRAYYRFDLQRYLASTKGQTVDGDVSVQVGRQLVNWANGLVLSEELDGGIVDLSYGNLGSELLVGRTRDDVTDFDPFRPGAQNDTDRLFAGGMLYYQFTQHRPYVYFLNQDDHNSNRALTAGGTTTRFKYDSWYVGTGSTGNITDNLLYAVELVYEGGTSLSRSAGAAGTQTEDDIRAYAADARLDYLFNDPRNSRGSVEFIAASGDSDRGITNSTFQGNQPGTKDNAFNAFGLLNTGFAFAPTVSNLLVLRTGVSTYPFSEMKALRRFQLGTDVFFFSKFNQDAPIDEPSRNDWWLGTELDVYATWQVTSDVSLLLRYGIFFPGSGISGDKDPRNFVAVGLTYAF
jgi:hypothetical protein